LKVKDCGDLNKKKAINKVQILLIAFFLVGFQNKPKSSSFYKFNSGNI